MHHVVLLNVAGMGYCTYAGSPQDGFVQQPLDMETGAVSRSVLAASRDLNDTVRHTRTPVSLTMRNETGVKPVVAFGCFFPETVDAQGRAGLVFIHALELDAVEGLASVVGAMIERLSTEHVRALARAVAAVAVQLGGVDGFLRGECAELVKRIPPRALPVTCLDNEASDLGGVEHDCRGAAPLAWLLMAHVMSRRAPGWSVVDIEEGDRISTRVRTSSGASQRTILASDVLHGAVRAYLVQGLDESLRAERSTVVDADAPTPEERPPSTSQRSPTRSPERPVRSARGPVYLAGASGILAGALITLLWPWSSHAVGAHGPDGGRPVVVRQTVCDAAVQEAVPPAPLQAYNDAGTMDDSMEGVAASLPATRGRDSGRRRAAPRHNGVWFPVSDRPGPRVIAN